MLQLRNFVFWLAAIACGATAYAQAVQGDVKSVGFKAPTTTGFVLREGQWFPILANLTVTGSDHQQVELHYESVDSDGDHVDYVEKPVILTAGGGQPIKRVWCYGTIDMDSSAAQNAPTLNVVGSNGATLVKLPVPPFDVISNDTLLVLDVSDRAVTVLRQLRGGSSGKFGDWGIGNRPYYYNIEVGETPAAELPDRWFGLEAVNVIVWDQPAPEKLNDAQLEALKQWVRNGGQLVVGLGPSWTRVQKSALADILPVQPPAQTVEATVTTQKLPRFFKRMLPANVAGRVEFKSPVALATAVPKPGALRTFWDTLPTGETASLVVMHNVGSGRVTVVAASLLDLTGGAPLQVPGVEQLEPQMLARPLLAELLDLNPTTPEFLKNEAQQQGFLTSATFMNRLYVGLVRPTEFQAYSSLLVFAVIGFVVAYILLATLASWLWLRRHNLSYLSWSVFAAFAVAASIVSLAMVRFTQGFSRVNSMSVVDLQADSADARVSCWFGYRSSVRQTPNLTLPGEGNYLRPLAHGPEPTGTYVTPERYEAAVGQSLLARAPMRATLKQFEGFWQGPLAGTVRGELFVDRASGRVLPESWLKNDLNQKIAGGWLLLLDPRCKLETGDVPWRAAGLTKDYRGRDVPPAVNVLAVEIPALEPGAKEAGALGAQQYKSVDELLAVWNPNSNSPRPDLRTLFDAQHKFWTGSGNFLAFGPRLNETIAAALLFSTRGLYLHCGEDFKTITNPLKTDGLVDRDVSHWLTRGQAVLLLYAEEPGPVKLHRNGEPMDVSEGKTVYRVRIPVQYRGQAPVSPAGQATGAPAGGQTP